HGTDAPALLGQGGVAGFELVELDRPAELDAPALDIAGDARREHREEALRDGLVEGLDRRRVDHVAERLEQPGRALDRGDTLGGPRGAAAPGGAVAAAAPA